MANDGSGAVYRGLEGNQVDNRKARCHYGIKCREHYNSKVHGSGQKTVWCEREQVWMVHDKMSWFINKVRPLNF